MNVLVVEPGYMPYEKEINGLKEEQKLVGGRIQAIYPFEEEVAVVCNEEGLLMDLPFNRSVPGGYGGVFGTFFVCGLGEEDFTSLTPEQTERYKEFFSKAEILLGFMNNQAVTLKVPATERRAEHEPHERRHDEPDR